MIAIVKSNFNQEVTDALLKGCIDCLNEKSTPFELFEVPGAVETVGFSNKLVATKKLNSSSFLFLGLKLIYFNVIIIYVNFRIYYMI